jgi:hypothetical protein
MAIKHWLSSQLQDTSCKYSTALSAVHTPQTKRLVTTNKKAGYKKQNGQLQ